MKKGNYNFSRPFTSMLLVGTAAAFSSYSAQAAVQTWKTAGFTDGSWATGTNWVSGTAPGGATGTASGDTATFNGNANLAVTPDATRNIKFITFDTGAGAFTIAGGGLVLTNAGAITINTGVTATQTINTDILLSTTASSTLAFTNNSSTAGAFLNIGGSVNGQGAAATTETLTLSGTNGGTVSGNIGNGSGGGVVAVTKSGAGTWTISGTNGYTGATTVGTSSTNAGALIFGSAASIGGTGRTVSVSAGGTVALQGSSSDAGIAAMMQRMVTTSAGTVAIDSNSSAAFDFNTGGLTAASLGALGNYTYTGTLTPNGTTYRVGGGGGTITFSGNNVFTGANVLNVNNSNGSSVAITGTNTFTGKTTISTGVLAADSLGNVTGGTDSSLGIPSSSANGTIQIGTSTTSTTNATLRYTGAGQTTDRILSLNVSAGSTATVDASGTGPVVFSSNMTFTGTGTGAVANVVFAGTNTGNNTYAGLLQDGNSGSGGNNILKSGTGTWLFNNSANTYKRTTTISAGTLVAGADAVNKLAPDQSAVKRGEQGTTVDFTNDTFTQVGGYANLVNGDKIVMGAGSAPTGTANGTSYFVVNANGSTFQISTTLGGSAVNFTTAGSNVGFYQVGAFGSASSAIALGDANTLASSAPTLLVGNGSSGYITNRPVTLTTSVLAGPVAATYAIGGNSDAINTFSGLITANKNLTVSQVTTTGVNELRVTGGITGSTLVDTSTAVNFAGPGKITVSGTGITDGAGGGTGKMSVVVSGGTVTLSNSNTFTGGLTISGGQLVVGSTSALPSAGNLALGGGAMSFGGFTPAATLGALSLTSSSSIDLGTGTVAVAFADSSAITWTGTLTLSNFDVGTDSMRFGTNSSGLTSPQLASISLAGYNTPTLDSSGFLQFTAIPEPSTYAVGISAMLVVVAAARKRRRMRN